MEEVFEISISSRKNRTWQGTLRAQGESIPFCSELELLLALARILPPDGLDAPREAGGPRMGWMPPEKLEAPGWAGQTEGSG